MKMEFPQLSTKRLKLKQISLADTQAIYDIFSNQDVVEYYDLAPFEDLAQAEKIIKFFQTRFESHSGIRWGIYFMDNSPCLGTCGFNSLDKHMHSATLGYDLNKKYWGQGIMTEALGSVIQTAFDNNSPFGPINRIQADTIPGNTASENVLRRLGFKEEGLRRQCGYWKDQYHDLKCFALLKNEFTT